MSFIGNVAENNCESRSERENWQISDSWYFLGKVGLGEDVRMELENLKT